MTTPHPESGDVNAHLRIVHWPDNVNGAIVEVMGAGDYLRAAWADLHPGDGIIAETGMAPAAREHMAAASVAIEIAQSALAQAKSCLYRASAELTPPAPPEEIPVMDVQRP